MKYILLILFALCPALFGAQPNVLFILVDDFGSRDLGCYGSTLYETPNMDRLAASGARFTQAYVAYPRCVPSRFAIFTGKHPARVQGVKDSPHVEPDRDATIGQAFKDLKLVDFPSEKRSELYDLTIDPGEAKNLAEARPEDTKRLLENLNAWRIEVGANMVEKVKKKK